MLTDKDRYKTEELLVVIKSELLRSPGLPFISIQDIHWLAQRLLELDNECKDPKPAVANIPNNPLTYGGMMIATWEGDRYKCIFCSNWNFERHTALEHAKSHVIRSR